VSLKSIVAEHLAFRIIELALM